jgi:hypothetical protein
MIRNHDKMLHTNIDTSGVIPKIIRQEKYLKRSAVTVPLVDLLLMACSPFIAIVSAAEIINLLCGH